MINRSLLKEVIVSNEDFIVEQVQRIVDREGIYIPATVKKTVVFAIFI